MTCTELVGETPERVLRAIGERGRDRLLEAGGEVGLLLCGGIAAERVGRLRDRSLQS
jgi:hypothetical protein